MLGTDDVKTVTGWNALEKRVQLPWKEQDYLTKEGLVPTVFDSRRGRAQNTIVSKESSEHKTSAWLSTRRMRRGWDSAFCRRSSYSQRSTCTLPSLITMNFNLR